MNKKTTVKIVFMVIFLLILTLIESIILPTLIASSFVNKNTAAYMLFAVDMPEHWNEHSKYIWIDTDLTYKETVNEDWLSDMSEIMVESYDKDHYTYVITNIMVSESGTTVDFETLWDALDESEFGLYMDDFVRMQAGYLVGDNLPPIPITTDLHSKLNDVVNTINNEELTVWYASNENAMVSSLKAAMLSANDVFSIEILETHPVFSESCLTLKILNVLLLFYSGIAFVVILAFCAIKLCRNKFIWISMAITQLFSAIAAAATYFSLEDINFVVLGIPYQPSSLMVKECWPIFLVLLGVELILCGVFTTIHFVKPKKKNISK